MLCSVGEWRGRYCGAAFIRFCLFVWFRFLFVGALLVARLVRRRQLVPGRLDAPDLAGVLGDGAVARELARRRDVLDAHLGPHELVLKTKKQTNKQTNKKSVSFAGTEGATGPVACPFYPRLYIDDEFVSIQIVVETRV